MKKPFTNEKIVFIIILLINFSHIKSQTKSNLETIHNDSIIGFATTQLTHRKPEGLLGNFITDGVKNESEIFLRKRVDLVFVSHNAIKGSINKGEISIKNIQEILPFDDSLVVMEISGKLLNQVLDRIAIYGGAPVSGINMKINNMRASDIFIDRDSLNLEKTYTFITIQRIAQGNENFSFLKMIPFKHLPLTLTEIIINYVKKLTKESRAISSHFGHRISY